MIPQLADNDAPVGRRSPGSASPRVSRVEPGKVLVADDDPALLRLLTVILKNSGYDVRTACDGRDLIDELATHGPFDVIVSDLNMPNLGGLAALKAVREQHLELPVILLTGNPELESALAALEYGAFRYLYKPVEPDCLLDVVGRAVRWNQLSRLRVEAADALGRVAEQGELGAAFARALDTTWMALQPIVSWKRKDVFAYEALVRNEEPTLADPGRLFDAAESLGRTARLGRQIRGRVTLSMASLSGGTPLFVNVHPDDLDDPDLLADNGTLTPYASRVVLEITERGNLDRVPNLGPRLARLRTLGYRIALDDLGAGYAGLSSVALLAPDVVKVDMSLVRGITASSLKQKLFRSMATLCDDLGIAMVAEGIETAEERDCVVSLGGDLLQGYLFARPGRGFPLPQF